MALKPTAGQVILAVGRDFPARCVVFLTLSHIGYKILTAADGEEAVRVADDCEGGIDLVLLIAPPGKKDAALISRLSKSCRHGKPLSLPTPISPAELIAKVRATLQN